MMFLNFLKKEKKHKIQKMMNEKKEKKKMFVFSIDNSMAFLYNEIVRKIV